MAAKVHPCKVGTVPGLVILRYNYKIEPNKRIVFRNADYGTKWQTGIITEVNDDGYFFIEKM